MQHGLPMGMSPNLILSKAKRRLGISMFKLPFDDNELLDIMYEDTIPTFSKFFPRYLTFPVDLNQCKPAKYRVADKAKYFGTRAYHIDFSQFGSEIVPIDIEDIDYYHNDQSDFIAYENELHGQTPYELVTNSFGRATLAASLNVEPIHRFEAPDILIFDEKGFGQVYGDKIFLTCLVLHAKDLSTINISYIDYFTKLYMIDLQINLYAVLKFVDKIDTTFGEIDLKIDDWANAEDKRKELEEDWGTKFLRHRRKTIRKI